MPFRTPGAEAPGTGPPRLFNKSFRLRWHESGKKGAPPRPCLAPGSRRLPGFPVMQYVRSLAIAAALASATSFSAPAQAGHHGDAVFAGVAGFAVGTLFGSAVSQPRYYAPAPVYVVPPLHAGLLRSATLDARLVCLLRAAIRQLRPALRDVPGLRRLPSHVRVRAERANAPCRPGVKRIDGTI